MGGSGVRIKCNFGCRNTDIGTIFHSFIIENQYITNSLSGIENRCQNIHAHKSPFRFHCYKCTIISTIHRIRSVVAPTRKNQCSLLFLFAMLLIYRTITPELCLGNLVLTLQAEMRGHEKILCLIIRGYGASYISSRSIAL